MAGRDQYLNFFTMDVTSGADSSSVVTADFNTGAGVATQLAWRIHCLEFYSHGSWSGATDGMSFSICISTRKGLSALPELEDKGTIARFRPVLTLYATANGTSALHIVYPHKIDYLPPLIVASPSFSIYFQASNNFAGQQSLPQICRIGFTTERLTESAYREVFETWNYAN